MLDVASFKRTDLKSQGLKQEGWNFASPVQGTLKNGGDLLETEMSRLRLTIGFPRLETPPPPPPRPRIEPW